MDHGSTSEPFVVDVAVRRAIRVENAAKRAQEAEKLRLQGNELFKKGDYVGAADLYAQAVNIHGPKPVLMSNLSAAYLRLELFDEAEWACTISLEYDPKVMKARFRRALARKNLKHFEAAKRDLQEILTQEPDNSSAREELKLIEESMQTNKGIPEGAFDKNPSYKDEPWELLSESETEDCKHIGNRMSCRFYNKGECSRGAECKFSHAPDAKSVRDEAGRNVCVHFLLDDCKFGPKCLYSHSRIHLAAEGWWNDSTQIQAAKDVSSQVEKNPDHRKLHELLLKNPAARTYASLQERKAVRSHLTRQLEEAKSKLQQQKPKVTIKPFVLVLSYEHEGFYLNINRHLFTALEQKAKVIYLRSKDWATQALEYLDSPSLTSVLITDIGITKKQYARVLQKLVEYTKNGGRVTISCQFSSLIAPLDFNKFIKTSWGLDWKYGSYFRSTFSVNPSNQIVQNSPSLHKSYSMKALHIANIAPEMAIYSGTDLANVADVSKREAPAVCAPLGHGLLSFLGDVNSEDQSTNTILAMLGILDPQMNRDGPSGSSTAATPRDTRRLDPAPLPPKITDKFVLILELEGDDHYKRVFAHQLAELEKRITVKFLYEDDVREIIELLQSENLYGVYIADEGIQNMQNMGVLKAVAKYGEVGGRVVFGGLFGQNADKEAFSFVFDFLCLPWKYGSSGTCEAQLNRHHEIAVRYPGLSDAFSMDAIHIKGFAPGDVLYKTCLNEDEKRQRRNSSNEEAAILRTRRGQGRVGYIGGVGAPAEVLLAMFDLPIPVPSKDVVPDSKKFLVMLTGKAEPVLSDILPDFMKDVREKVEVILGISPTGLSNARIIDLLPSQDLVGVLVMDEHLLRPENAYLLSKLVEYTKNGGTVVCGSVFGSSVTPAQLKHFFHSNWDLEWEVKTILHEDIPLKRNFESPLFHGKKAKDIKLPKTARLGGFQIKGITKPMAVYFPSTQTELWNPETSVYTSSIIYTEVAEGHLGYLGTPAINGEARDIIYAMFGLI